MRLVTVSPQETAFLAQEVKDKYETLSGEELVITSYLARYEGLMETIKSRTSSTTDVEMVSTGLLRKLLESGKRNESTNINRQFIDICYLFITDCQYTRSQYNEKIGSTTEHLSTNGSSTHTLNWPNKGQRIHFSMPKNAFYLSAFLLFSLLTWTISANWQYLLLQVPTPAPKYLWWVAEYPDGTKVYNHFRRYRKEKDVIDYFLGRGLEDSSRTGDCNAIYWSENNRVNVCYDTIETIRKFEEEHGGSPEIRFDG